jgi:hypothetical protein
MIQTEDDVVIALCSWLKSEGWTINKCCTGRQRGNDVEATKGKRFLIVEAKGSKGKLSHTVRKKFDSGQLKTHLGKAIVKLLEQKTIYPNAELAIAHPSSLSDDPAFKLVKQQLKRIGIKTYWVGKRQV